jgi:hypothetical protein
MCKAAYYSAVPYYDSARVASILQLSHCVPSFSSVPTIVCALADASVACARLHTHTHRGLCNRGLAAREQALEAEMERQGFKKDPTKFLDAGDDAAAGGGGDGAA